MHGNKRTIVENVIPGYLKADVTVYSLPDGKTVGGFQLKVVSSALPSTEGGMDGAVDRDLVKQANATLIQACSAARRARRFEVSSRSRRTSHGTRSSVVQSDFRYSTTSLF